METERKKQGQERIFSKHYDGLERSDFCGFEKPRKRTHQKGNNESNEQSMESGQPKKVCGKELEARQIAAQINSQLNKLLQSPTLFGCGSKWLLALQGVAFSPDTPFIAFASTICHPNAYHLIASHQARRLILY